MRWYWWCKGQGLTSLSGPISIIPCLIFLPFSSTSARSSTKQCSCAKGCPEERAQEGFSENPLLFLERQQTVYVLLWCVYMHVCAWEGHFGICTNMSVCLSNLSLSLSHMIWKACIVLVRWKDYVTRILVFNVHYHIYYHIKTRCLKFGLEIL